MKRAPQWFTHGSTRATIHELWPYALGLSLGCMYWYAPEPFEQARLSTLYAIRRPVLKSTEWLEVADIDTEAFQLDLPPDQIFGPLMLKKQMKFVLQALRDDNELADGYVTRLTIDHMDLSLDPPFLGSSLADAGAGELIDLAVADYYDKREGAKFKFFDADRLLRVLNMCANDHSLSQHLMEKHDGVSLIFHAMDNAADEYSRILGMRVLTLGAMLQERDGTVEKRILHGGHVPAILDYYRQSTGDPTDTRFITLLLSSIVRLYPHESYLHGVQNNMISATVGNLNISRYKGLPQHVRLLNDLCDARRIVLDANGNVRMPDKAAKLLGPSALEAANTAATASSGGFFGWVKRLFGGSSDTVGAHATQRTTPKPAPAGKREEAEMKDLSGLRGHARQVNVANVNLDRSKHGMHAGMQKPADNDDDDELDNTGADDEVPERGSNRLPPLPPPRNIKAPFEELLVDADFVPVALGLMDVFPEYFEAVREITDLLYRSRHYVTPFELFEHRFFPVAIQVFARHLDDVDFEQHEVGRKLTELCESIFNDPECRPYLQPDCKYTNQEIRHSLVSMREMLDKRQAKLASGVLPPQKKLQAPAAA